MKQLSLKPDEHMEWIYKPSHPEYNTDRAKSLRARRTRALLRCPQWMRDDAELNDAQVKDSE